MKTGIKVNEAMTKNLITIPPDTTILDCTKIMLKNNVGGMLIKEGNQLKGILTEKDILKFFAQDTDKNLPVSEVMEKKVVTIEPEKDLYDAMHLMSEEEVRRLPVVSNNKLVGHLTEKDILKIQPALFDICAERITLREEKDKLSRT